MDLPSISGTPLRAPFACPYCEALINGDVLSCRCCGRDLTPVLPLLRRLDALEGRVAEIEAAEAARAIATLATPRELDLVAEKAGERPVADGFAPTEIIAPVRRRLWALALGYGLLMAAYWMVVIWLDLPLSLLRLASFAIPVAAGLGYLGRRARLTWFDAGVALLFGLVCVGSMNALLGWIDDAPMVPQGTNAWRETMFYVLSVSASFYCGMLMRVTQVALSARGLTSLPRLHESLIAVNGKVPDTLKAIELAILLVGTIVSAITGVVAGIMGVTR